ncbi:MAG: hypothetical protein AAF203_10665 [Pseudomonadota bacterium]
MLRIAILFLVFSGLMSSPVCAQSARNNKAQTHQKQNKEVSKPKKTKASEKKAKVTRPKVSLQWERSEKSIVQAKGILGANEKECRTFNISLAEQLNFIIDCYGIKKEQSFALSNHGQNTVTKTDSHLTITSYSYMIKKAQTSQLEQDAIKVPFVEQIIHIKRQANGELAFYLEHFKVDVFGRVVQDGFIQAYGLTKKEIKISSNK